MFVVHTEDIREAWITAIKKLQPKGTVCAPLLYTRAYIPTYVFACTYYNIKHVTLHVFVCIMHVHTYIRTYMCMCINTYMFTYCLLRNLGVYKEFEVQVIRSSFQTFAV